MQGNCIEDQKKKKNVFCKQITIHARILRISHQSFFSLLSLLQMHIKIVSKFRPVHDKRKANRFPIYAGIKNKRNILFLCSWWFFRTSSLSKFINNIAYAFTLHCVMCRVCVCVLLRLPYLNAELHI